MYSKNVSKNYNLKNRLISKSIYSENITDTLHVYQMAKRCNEVRGPGKYENNGYTYI